MSDLHSWFHIRFIKGGIQEALSHIKDDDERESFFLIVLEKVNNQGLTGPHVLVRRGLLCGFQYATRLHGRDILWYITLFVTAVIKCIVQEVHSRCERHLCGKVRRVVFADVFGATCFRVDGTPIFSEGVLVLFNLVSSEFQILMRT